MEQSPQKKSQPQPKNSSDTSSTKKKISVDEPIKSLGVHNVKIKLHPKVTADLKVKVTEK